MPPSSARRPLRTRRSPASCCKTASTCSARSRLRSTVSAARRMIATAERNGSRPHHGLEVPLRRRRAQGARDSHGSGEIGELVFAENAFTSLVDMRNRWNSDAAVSGGGVLIDNGTHAVDILRYLLGNFATFRSVEGRRMQGLAVEDTVRLFVHNDDGVHGRCRSLVEHRQGARNVPAHLRQHRDHSRRMARVAISPHRRSGVARLRTGLQQDPSVPRSARATSAARFAALRAWS